HATPEEDQGARPDEQSSEQPVLAAGPVGRHEAQDPGFETQERKEGSDAYPVPDEDVDPVVLGSERPRHHDADWEADEAYGYADQERRERAAHEHGNDVLAAQAGIPLVLS